MTNSDVTIPAANTLDVSAGTLTLAKEQIGGNAVDGAFTFDGGDASTSDATAPDANNPAVTPVTYTLANDQNFGTAAYGRTHSVLITSVA